MNWIDGVIIDSILFEVMKVKFMFDLKNDLLKVEWIVID